MIAISYATSWTKSSIGITTISQITILIPTSPLMLKTFSGLLLTSRTKRWPWVKAFLASYACSPMALRMLLQYLSRSFRSFPTGYQIQPYCAIRFKDISTRQHPEQDLSIEFRSAWRRNTRRQISLTVLQHIYMCIYIPAGARSYPSKHSKTLPWRMYWKLTYTTAGQCRTQSNKETL